MLNNLKKPTAKLSSNQQGVASIAKVIVGLILVAIVGYSEIAFLSIMASSFPDGIVKVVAMIGAVATGLSVLTLLVAKAYWFRPGAQTVFAWCFTGVEVAVLILNVMLSFALSHHQVTGILSYWYDLCPASPLLAMVGWILIIHLDRSQQQRHLQSEMEEDVWQAERQHDKDMHSAVLDLRQSYLRSTAAYLQQEANSPEVQAELAYGASIIAAHALSQITGQQIAPRLGRNNAKQLTKPIDASIIPVAPIIPSDQQPAQDDAEIARLKRLANAAEAKGYSLDKLERMLGVPPESEAGQNGKATFHA